MKDQFTYSNRTGNKMRTYAKVAIWIFVLVAAIGVVAAVNRNQMVSEVMATPRPLDSALIPPSATVAAVLPVVTTEDCPSDPAAWTLSDNAYVPGSNLKVLAPQCVYDNLEKTAAWVYGTTALGYTRADAAALLRLDTNGGLISYPATGKISVLTDYKNEPQQVEVSAGTDKSNLAEWFVDQNGATGLELSFSGCFTTSTLEGGQVSTWGDGYPVVCQFFADYRYQYAVHSINGHLFTVQSVQNVRYPTWFGYVGNGNWTWLGNGRTWGADLSGVTSRQSTLSATVMAQKYGMSALPLPQNWQSAVGQEFQDALLAELNNNQ